MEVVLSKILADVEANAVSIDIVSKLKDAVPSIKSMTVAQKNSSYKKAVKLYNVTRRSDTHFDLRLLCCQVIAWTKIETSKVLDVFRCLWRVGNAALQARNDKMAYQCFEYAVEVLNNIGKESFYHFLSQRSAADSDAILKAALQILFAQTKLVSAGGATSVKLESVKRYWYKTKEILLLLPAEEREIEQEARTFTCHIVSCQLGQLAERCFRAKLWEECVFWCDENLTLLENSAVEDTKERVHKLLLIKADTLFHAGRFQESLDCMAWTSETCSGQALCLLCKIHLQMNNTDAAKQAFERALENPSPPSFALVIDILRQQLCWTASQLREMHQSVARYFPDRQHVLDLDVLKTILAFPEHTAEHFSIIDQIVVTFSTTSMSKDKTDSVRDAQQLLWNHCVMNLEKPRSKQSSAATKWCARLLRLSTITDNMDFHGRVLRLCAATNFQSGDFESALALAKKSLRFTKDAFQKLQSAFFLFKTTIQQPTLQPRDSIKDAACEVIKHSTNVYKVILALAMESVEVQSLPALDVVEEITFDLDMAACDIVTALDFFANLIKARLGLDRSEKCAEALAVVTRYCQKLIKINPSEKQLAPQSVTHLEAIVCAAWNIIAARSRQGNNVSVSHTDQDLCLSLANLIRVSPHYETPKTLQVLRQLLCRKLVAISTRLQKKAVVQGEIMQPQEITELSDATNACLKAHARSADSPASDNAYPVTIKLHILFAKIHVALACGHRDAVLQLLKDAFRIKTERVTELMHQAKRLAEVYISRGRDSSTTVDIRSQVLNYLIQLSRGKPQGDTKIKAYYRELLAIQPKQQVASSYHDIFTSFKTVVETDPDFRQFVLGYLIFDIKTSAGLTVETEFRKCLEEVPVEWKSKLEIMEPLENHSK